MFYYDGGGFFVGLIIGFFVWLIVLAVFYVLTAIFLKNVFQKAGVANPNVAWIPVYNFMLLAKLGDVNPWLHLGAVGLYIVFAIIPVVGGFIAWIPGLALLALHVLIAYRVNLKFGKEPVLWTIFAAFLSIIWLGVLGFGKSAWNNTAVPAPPWINSFLADTTTFGGVPHQGYSKGAPPAAPAA